MITWFDKIQDVNVFECPTGWEEHKDHCYRFVRDPEETAEGVKIKCQEDEAYGLSINSEEEHIFVRDTLERIDAASKKLDWWTSGRRLPSNRTRMFWEGDGTMIESFVYWQDPSIPGQLDKDRILYNFNGISGKWGWILGQGGEKRPFICEISKEDIFRINSNDRGPDYGINEPDPTKIKRGPKFITQPRKTVYENPKGKNEQDDEGDILSNPGGIVKEEKTFLDCVADSVPQPKYTWLKHYDGKTTVIEPSDKHYTIINGRLNINKPDEKRDVGIYQCMAGNQHGIILSNTAELSFGYLHNFPKSPRARVVAKSHDTASIYCAPPDHTKPILFAWYKNSISNFVRPNLKPYTFISYDGHLYFSEVTVDDKGSYYCMVYKPEFLAKGKISMPNPLHIEESSAATYEPLILDKFPKIFPSSPKVGDKVRIECFAKGSARPGPKLNYFWRRLESSVAKDGTVQLKAGKRKELPLPKNSFLEDHNRVLTFENVQLYDAGVYECKVSRQTGKEDSRTKTLNVVSPPFFITPIKDKFIDANVDLQWRCVAGGTGDIAYKWLKNGLNLESSNRIQINNNVLKIKKVDAEKDNGMYQCRATNTQGVRFSTAELRVLSFAPNFQKYPLKPNLFATLRGNATLICRPEAAPYPKPDDIQWYKGSNPLTPDGRIQKLPNGNLLITGLTMNDRGFYECKVKNDLGEASTKGNLTILTTTSIVNPPMDEVVQINKTRFFHCIASHATQLDVTYIWYQGPYMIEFERIYRLGETNFQIWRNPTFKRGTGFYMGGLYIMNAKAENQGKYTCRVESSAGNFESSAFLRVISPPSMPVSLQIIGRVTAFKATLSWREALNNGGRPVHTFVLEAFNGWEKFWKVIRTNIPADRVEDVKSAVNLYNITLNDLRPFSNYYFRVRAENSLGTSEPSIPSKMIETLETKPDLAPKQVGGGGGKVGTLHVSWEPLKLWEHNGKGLYYIAYRRKKGDQEFKASKKITDPEKSYYTFEVGQNNFYLLYEVRVQACNNLGCGPLSEIVEIYSSMSVPVITAEDVRAQPFNATACIVHWIPVTDSREKLKGKLGGYRISYWKDKGGSREGAPRVTVDGQADEALVIGLEPDTMYKFDVMIWNEAGNGPKSQEFPQRTFRNSPINQPTEVQVLQIDSGTIDVFWRGVSTDQREEPLDGYKVRIWRSGTHIKVADDYDAGKETEIRIRNMNPHNIYKLRVFGYSRGGDGTMSSPSIKFHLDDSYRLMNNP
ncbi:DgyrCDS4405 [Dimorphilus gyrociliatus]|uniref:DgyrCDS4405 n=1 Tax=Dimorphilus gyrociliatus TaxID=2664684 RepID=A0A7I8VHG2_9ANNE|nr:DgyrCDS4405 [Dimorphilus gyrociliatus]